MANNIFCIECGFELPSTAKFCKKCGVQIEAGESPSESDTEIKEDKPSVTEPVTEASSSKANKTSNVILEWVITFAVAIIVFFMGGILFGAKNGSWIGVIGFLISRALVVTILRSIFPHRYEYEDKEEEYYEEEDEEEEDEEQEDEEDETTWRVYPDDFIEGDLGETGWREILFVILPLIGLVAIVIIVIRNM